MSESLWQPFKPENILDPYPMYKRLREADSVYHAQTHEWIVTSYEEVRSILRSNKFHVGSRLDWIRKGIKYDRQKQYDFSALDEIMDGFLLFLNPPDHTRIRKFIAQVWSNRDVDQVIQKNVDRLLNDLPGDTVNFIETFSKPLPALTITQLLGLPEQDHTKLKELGSSMIKTLDLYLSLRDLERINTAAREFINYFKLVVDEKIAHPDGGLISKMILFNREQRQLTESELISACVLLFVAGEETTLGLTGTGIMNLAMHPKKWDELNRSPALIPGAVQELMRYDAPAQIAVRFALDDVIIKNKTIPKGSVFTLCLGAANRDPMQFANPDDLVFTRSENKHLSFGGGAHYCLGDWLAERQAVITLEKIFDRFASISLAGEPKWNNNLSFRSLLELPIKLLPK